MAPARLPEPTTRTRPRRRHNAARRAATDERSSHFLPAKAALLRFDVQAPDDIQPDRAFVVDHLLEVGPVARRLVDAERLVDLLHALGPAALDHQVRELLHDLVG